jgi:lambda repressor-like predicted transcriptional regulator
VSLFGANGSELFMPQEPHPEDIKAALRKRYKSIAAYERAKGLPSRSVKDVLSGKSRPKIADAIASELDSTLHELFPNRY